MKIIVAVLSALLLVVGPIYSLSNCREEPEQTYYFIYNTSVPLKTYYCSYTDEEDSQCKNSNGKLLTRNPSGVTLNCDTGFYANLNKRFALKRFKVNFCQLSARTSLPGNIVEFSDKAICMHNNGACYNSNISKDVFLGVNDICHSLVLMYHGNFTVWTSLQDQVTFISEKHTSLLLTEKIELCGYEMWKTNYKNIVVSKNYTVIHNLCLRCPKLESNLEEFCEDNASVYVTNKQPPTDIKKTWYVYKYPIKVTVYMCHVNLSNSCKDMDFTETDPKNYTNLSNQCISNFCKSSSTCNYESKTTICQAAMLVDLEKDLVRDLPSECKYSDGLCEPIQTFWYHTARCNAIQKVYEGYAEQCSNTKCVTDEHNSRKLILLREGKLCGETVWYTDEDGLVASERALALEFPSEYPVLPHENQWRTVAVEGYFIISFLTVCLLWIGLKIAMCLIYLCTRCKNKEAHAASEGVELRKMRKKLPVPQI